MALISTAVACISRPEPAEFPLLTPKVRQYRSVSIQFPIKQQRFPLRNSSDTSSETAVENPSETPVETSKGFSLITASNVEKALRGIPITSADHYGRLGIQRGASYDQVNLSYKNKCEELMNQELNEEEASKELELLKESYAILSSEEERRLYDWSLARSAKPERYVWPFEVDITQTPTQPPPPQEPEDVGPTRLVGYFSLVWFILGCALSVTLNR
eukprot:TRINITY_DN316_c0_g1_i2.p1 TRINITY_DN316_c0_g1~~TRINITY_DN316_c0_g1_i2.p1  ORF type:complete len:216 (-),score=28.07 TRINITY_DN316_c0_g1_i2:288-935(-)